MVERNVAIFFFAVITIIVFLFTSSHGGLKGLESNSPCDSDMQLCFTSLLQSMSWLYFMLH